ncbi:MAG: glycosyltransferase [bacterium]|nr:MAG: glycosyltransferase [bacterium]
MRVLLANSERGMRGGELQTLALATGLRERGCEVNVAVAKNAGLIRELEGRIDYAVFRFESPPLVTPSSLARLIAGWHPHILHAQTSRAHTCLWFARRLLRLAPPLVVSRRVAFRTTRGVPGYLKYRTGVAHYIPISQAAAGELAASGIPADSMTIIPSGIDVGRFRQSRGDGGLLPHWGVDRRQFLIATVGAFEREKGYDTLVRAAGKVLGSHPSARFLWFGEGSRRSHLIRTVRSEGLEGRVLLLPIERPLEEVLPLFDLFVLPSLSEGLSTALMAALASGLPVVASDTGGIPEVVSSGWGSLVPPGDHTALAEAIIALIDDDVRRGECAKAGRERAAAFDIAHTVDRTLQVYRDVLSGIE